MSKSDAYNLKYHITPTHGLLNDPNGLAHFQGQYHVFYQWNPYGTEHKNKSWGHVVSDNLVNWHRKEMALDTFGMVRQGRHLFRREHCS